MSRRPDPPSPILLAWVTEGKKALVVGGGSVSTRRVQALLDGKAWVTVVAPEVSATIAAQAERSEILLHRRPFDEADLDDADLVLVAIDDHAESARICHASRARRIPVHVADDPPLCDFYFAAMERRGPVQVAVSTGGAGPALAGRLRNRLAAALPERLEEAVERFGRLRAAVRSALPDDAQMKARMRWLTAFGRSAPWDELAELSDERIAQLAAEARSSDSF